MNDLSFVMAFPELCTAEVTREGRSEPCERVAIAVLIDPEEGDGYPVCVAHARGRRMPLVPLAEVIAAAKAGAS